MLAACCCFSAFLAALFSETPLRKTVSCHIGLLELQTYLTAWKAGTDRPRVITAREISTQAGNGVTPDFSGFVGWAIRCSGLNIALFTEVLDLFEAGADLIPSIADFS